MAGTLPFDPNNGLTNTQQTYYNATTTGDTQQQGTTAGTTANQYTSGQQALQNQLPQTLQSLLTGGFQIPGYMTAPPQAFQAYNDAFNNYVKPGIAAQYGAGSPQIASQQSMGNEQLAANLYENGVHNYMGLLGQADSLAFTPIGANSANATNMNWQNQSDVSGYQGDNILGSLLNKLVGGLKF